MFKASLDSTNRQHKLLLKFWETTLGMRSFLKGSKPGWVYTKEKLQSEAHLMSSPYIMYEQVSQTGVQEACCTFIMHG